MLGRKHSDTTKNQMSKKHIGNKYSVGHLWSIETRQKILKKRIGSKRSNETRLKMSNTAKRINSIGRVDHSKNRRVIVDQYGNKYESLVEAAKITGCSIQAICDLLKGRTKKNSKGYIFQYEKTNIDKPN